MYLKTGMLNVQKGFQIIEHYIRLRVHFCPDGVHFALLCAIDTTETSVRES